MNPLTHKSRIEGMVADRNMWRLATVGLVIANIVISAGWLKSSGEVRTTLVPAEIRKSFWIQGDDVSQEYLEQMGLYFAELALNITPNSVDYKAEVFLKYVNPMAHGPLKTRMMLEAQRIKRINASQAFFPRELNFDTPGKRVAIRGDLVTFVGEQRIKTESQTWRLALAMSGGMMSVTEFIKVDNDDPFEKKPQKKQQDVDPAATAAGEHNG